MSYTVLRDDLPVRILKKGDQIKVWLCFKWCEMTVGEVFVDAAYDDLAAVAYSKHGELGAFLDLLKGNEYWECCSFFNPKGIAKVEFA